MQVHQRQAPQVRVGTRSFAAKLRYAGGWMTSQPEGGQIIFCSGSQSVFGHEDDRTDSGQ
eukprot:2256688-Pyramimonas_sp.AAC.1